MTTHSANRQIARAAGVVMFAFVLSNVVGLVRQILISRAFGTGDAYDAFVAASRYPDLIFNLIAGGALASSFIPVVTEFLEREDRASAWKLTSAVINLVVLVLTAISLISAIFSLQVIQHILAPDFSPEKQQLAAALLRILLIAPTVFGVSGIVMGALNAHQKFLLPALASTMLWVGYIFGLIFFVPSMGIFGLAWGAVLGAFLHIGIQIPQLLRLPEWRFNFSLGLDDAAVREVLLLMGPRLLGVAVVQINFLVNTIIASGQPEGSVSSLTYAFQIMTMPEVAIAQAIAVAALPTFSAQAARGELGEMRRSLASTLRGVLLLSLPATLGLILLRYPVIALLYQRGQFDAHSTDMVAWALLWYTVGLVGHSVVEILSRAFYALHDTRTPVIVGTIAMSLNIVFSFAFSALFASLGWMPHGGLALANSFATALEGSTLFILMRLRLKGLDSMNIGRGLLQSAIATAIMCAIIIGWLNFGSPYSVWIVAPVGIIAGGMAYALMMYILRVPELNELINAIRRRVGLAQ
ncbi:MAG TPA: murein biosynthesis integral membrane protein MurJ [Anaerolineales bacterium]|nr:murein biosynthesis integral membrane protein MurJ [Anaerolineales bacterium]